MTEGYETMSDLDRVLAHIDDELDRALEVLAEAMASLSPLEVPG